jgi:lipopolysaccharide/colanic/teichoic acid biosynthesis glycosyltransferase
VNPKPLVVYVEPVVAAVLLVAFLPLLALLALAIILDSGRPVLVRRRTRTQLGAPVDLLTFRTQARTREGFTRVGWLLYVTCLDLLPCLWNVLAGQIRMSDAVRSCSRR